MARRPGSGPAWAGRDGDSAEAPRCGNADGCLAGAAMGRWALRRARAGERKRRSAGGARGTRGKRQALEAGTTFTMLVVLRLLQPCGAAHAVTTV
jgi:hypothetical protein